MGVDVPRDDDAPPAIFLSYQSLEQYRRMLEERRRHEQRSLISQLVAGIAATALVTLTIGVTVRGTTPTPGFGALAAAIGAVAGLVLAAASALIVMRQWRQSRHDEFELEVLTRAFEELRQRRDLIANPEHFGEHEVDTK